VKLDQMREDVTLQGMDMFDEHMVLFVRKNGHDRQCSINLLPIDLDSEVLFPFSYNYTLY
jgi:hypothetical protein